MKRFLLALAAITLFLTTAALPMYGLRQPREQMFSLRLCAVVAKPRKPCGGVSLQESRRLLFCRYALYRRRKCPNDQGITLGILPSKPARAGFRLARFTISEKMPKFD